MSFVTFIPGLHPLNFLTLVFPSFGLSLELFITVLNKRA